jgi:tetratricopeptide (TPR) repeat protein
MREGLAFQEQLALRLQRRWFRGNLAEITFERGLWDEALRFANEELDDPEPHYMHPTCRRVRAYVRLARGDVDGALADMEASTEQSRAIRDPQDLFPALAESAHVHAVAGELAAAAALLEELAEARAASDDPTSAGIWIVTLAFALLELGREGEFLADEGRIGVATPWSSAALAVARGDLVGAADVLLGTGATTFEAYARLRAAAKLAQAGQHAEAARQLAGPLAFYRAVGAVRYLREAEALLAAAS